MVEEEALVGEPISCFSTSCFSEYKSSNNHHAKSLDSFRVVGCDDVRDLDEKVMSSSTSENSIVDETRWKNGLVRKDEAEESRSGPSSQKDCDDYKRRSSYLELINYHEMNSHRTCTVTLLEEAKDSIRRYKPGQWIERVGNILPSEYDVPSTTTLLLVGPRGSGKSSLVNRISRIFEDDPLLPDRAQISYNLSATEGTCFLHEYMISKDPTSFCIYDTRSLSENASDNFKLLKMWMTQCVKHGVMVLRDSDALAMKAKIKAKVRHGSFAHGEKRKVNFAIFVVDGVLILKSMRNKDKQYNDLVVETFNYPFMSFRDNKPAVVVTHGDQLSFMERAEVCTYLGELLGIPPTTQIFDIPDISTPATELTIMEMLRYSLEQADRNLPFKQNFLQMIECVLRRMIDEMESTTLTVTLTLFLIGSIILFVTPFASRLLLNW